MPKFVDALEFSYLTMKRLAGPAFLATSAADLYTAGTGVTTTVRHIRVCNETSSQALFTLSLGTDGAGKRLYKDWPVAANSVFEDEGLLAILAPAEKLQGFSDTGTALTITIHGIENS